MIVLGLGTGVDSGAALVEDGVIRAAVNEERLCRMKLVEGFPRASIARVLELAGVAPGELDAVLVGATQEPWVDELRAFDGWFQQRPSGLVGLLKRAAGPISRYRDRLPLLEKAYYALQEPAFRRRRRAIPEVLSDEFGVRCPVSFVDHHFAHVASARFTSGLEDCLVVSLDGGGDARSGLVCHARGSELRRLHEVSAYDSLGNWYAYVTHLCGFKAQKHEGKIMGLAARGEPRHVALLDELIVEEAGTFVNRSGRVFRDAMTELERRLPAGWDAADLAASVQHHFERLVRRFVSHWRDRSGATGVAVAGGVFANVRVNQVIHETPDVEQLFVHPGMTDGGLAVGAALAACAPGILDVPMVRSRRPLPDVYLGPTLTPAEIDEALRDAGLEPTGHDGATTARIADLLADGYVVARAAGRMEYGPRALGNRSIFYRPNDPSVNDWLNDRLARTEFMPFAPAILFEERERCFEDVAGAERAARFMTVTFRCTDWMQREMPGVVHVDGTARPQLVSREEHPEFHAILSAYRDRTGLPGVINTSFNRHEEPIVCTARDAVRAFLQAELDYLAIGDRLVAHPRLESDASRPAGATSPSRAGPRGGGPGP